MSKKTRLVALIILATVSSKSSQVNPSALEGSPLRARVKNTESNNTVQSLSVILFSEFDNGTRHKNKKNNKTSLMLHIKQKLAKSSVHRTQSQRSTARFCHVPYCFHLQKFISCWSQVNFRRPFGCDDVAADDDAAADDDDKYRFLRRRCCHVEIGAPGDT